MIKADTLEALMYDLPLLVAAFRRRNRLTQTLAAQLAGVGKNTIARIEAGYPCDVTTLIALLRWMEN